MQVGGETRELAVNLASAEESDVEPRFEAPSGEQIAVGPVPHGKGAQVPLWGAFALAGFLLLVAEWAAWLREAAAARPRSVP